MVPHRALPFPFLIAFLALLFAVSTLRAASAPFEASTPVSSHSINVSIPAPPENSHTALQPADVQITVDQIIAPGFSSPVQVTHAGDGSGRQFVVEQTGRIRIIKNGQVLATPFLNLSALIDCCGERGLLGLAFHPNYASNGFFYVNYTRASDGDTVIARYSASANPDLANPNSAFTLLTIFQPFANHNGGGLVFGPLDGYLYIGTGDGGSAGDPQDNGQDVNSLLGKMLRIDVDSGTPYANPPDNPYVGQTGRDEIWAIGLRNPWRYSFDRQSGDMYIGDVGQNLWEEVDFQAAGTTGGLNFGWRCKEGDHIFNFAGCAGLSLVDPIAEYSHSEGNAVTGGFVYRGTDFPALQGRYFYADYGTGKIWSLYQTSKNPITWSAPELELDNGFPISSFGEDENGELYVVDYTGKIRRLADVNGPTPALSSSKKLVSSPSADPQELITYTILLTNTGSLATRPLLLTDTIPAGLSYVPGSLSASSGAASDQANPVLTWQGNLGSSQRFTITYQVEVSGLVTGSLVNQAELTSPPDVALSLAQSLFVPRSVLTTTIQDFILPGTQPGQLSADLTPSVDCDICHSPPIYDRWRGSMMSQAGRDPLMWAALAIANIDAPNSGEYCLRCHTPKGWLAGRSHPTNGSALQAGDIANGVACAVCHRLVDPVASASDEAAAIDDSIRSALTNPVPLEFITSAAMIVDPQDRRRGPFSFGLGLPFHSAYKTDFLGQGGSAITCARMCGTCHNVSNPVLSWDTARGQFWPNSMNVPAPEFDRQALFPIETTYDEWLYSDFASGGVSDPQFAASKADGIVETCQDCHMPRRIGSAADPAFNPAARDCQAANCLPEHTFAGANAWVPQLLQEPGWRLNAANESSYLQAGATQARLMLYNAATITATLSTGPGEKTALVRVTNLSGHKLPTGYPEGRRMWINLKAFDGAGQLVYESGTYDPATGTLQSGPGVKVYEARQGLTPDLAAALSLPPGESFHFVLNNTVIKDNRIPPRGVTQAEYDRPGLRPVGAVYPSGQHWDDTLYTLPAGTASIWATLYYQTSSREYVDFLRRNGGIDGLAVGELWDGLKSPPETVAWVVLPGFNLYQPWVAR